MNNNSILFDFDAIVDKELSTILWIRATYRDSELPNFNKHKIMYTPIENFMFDRCLGSEDLFKSLIEDEKYKDNAEEIMNKIYNANEEDILRHVSLTSCRSLINGYKTAAGGVIHSTVRVDNDIEKKFIEDVFENSVPVLKESRKDINVDPYTRLVVGYYKTAVEYKIKMKSIMILDFRENFDGKDITCLNPELIIRLGDMNHLSVMSAYTANTDINIVD